jgi:thioredoxin reductase (NADPH)
MKPVISIVDPDEALSADVRRRFGMDYDVDVAKTEKTGFAHLQASAESGAQVALVIAPYWMGGIDYLIRARVMHPKAKRLLMIRVGDVGAQSDIRRALTLNQIDFFFGTPWASPEEELYPVVSEALRLWAHEHLPRYDKATIIDHHHAGFAREIQSYLEPNLVWTSFHTVDSWEAQQLAKQHDLSLDTLPVMVLWDGRVLVDPNRADVAEALGAPTRAPLDTVDLAIVGCGPAGLASAAYAASEGLRVLGIEPYTMGGQAGTTSKIRNYLGFRWGITGGEFGQRAYAHAQDLGADFMVTRSAVGLQADGDLRIITLDNGDVVASRAVLLSGGVAYRRLGVPQVDDLAGAGVFYGASASEAQSMSGLDVFVLGGGNSAGQIATHLAGCGARTTLLIRRELGPPMADYLIKEIQGTTGLTVRSHTEVVGAGSEQQLEHLVLRDSQTNQEESVKADAFFVFIGARPHSAWLADVVALDDHGFIVTGRDVPPEAWALDHRPPALLETSTPGVFAAGDIRRGSVKRVAAAVGEGSTATLLVREYLDED